MSIIIEAIRVTMARKMCALIDAKLAKQFKNQSTRRVLEELKREVTNLRV